MASQRKRGSEDAAASEQSELAERRWAKVDGEYSEAFLVGHTSDNNLILALPFDPQRHSDATLGWFEYQVSTTRGAVVKMRMTEISSASGHGLR